MTKFLGSILMTLSVLVLSAADAFAQDDTGKADATAATAGAPKAKKKTTEVSFEDVLVQGKYHFSDEAVSTVEQDKVLDALLGVRTDFKDRLKKSTTRY